MWHSIYTVNKDGSALARPDVAIFLRWYLLAGVLRFDGDRIVNSQDGSQLFEMDSITRLLGCQFIAQVKIFKRNESRPFARIAKGQVYDIFDCEVDHAPKNQLAINRLEELRRYFDR